MSLLSAAVKIIHVNIHELCNKLSWLWMNSEFVRSQIDWVSFFCSHSRCVVAYLSPLHTCTAHSIVPCLSPTASTAISIKLYQAVSVCVCAFGSASPRDRAPRCCNPIQSFHVALVPTAIGNDADEQLALCTQKKCRNSFVSPVYTQCTHTCLVFTMPRLS